MKQRCSRATPSKQAREGARESAKHPDDAHRFFGEAARALDSSDAILIVGPSSAKLEFFRYLHEHDRHLEAKVVGVESADHPTDGEIVARAKELLQGNRPNELG